MNCYSVSKNTAIPKEYREITQRLFPEDGFYPGQGPDSRAIASFVKAASDFAEALGIGAEYQRLLKLEKCNDELRTFLRYFQNNLDLLIQKTWVEKTDEERKERLQDDVPSLMALIEQGKFPQAIEEFGVILEELAYLFFGAQSKKDDFTEYTFRIDNQIGLFWWYGCRLTSLKGISEKNASEVQAHWAVLLIGICYLANF